MANFILRKFDDALWHKVKVRAVTERMSLRSVILALLQMYAEGLKLKKKAA